MRRGVLLCCGAVAVGCGSIVVACGQFGADTNGTANTEPDGGDAAIVVERSDAGDPVITEAALDSGAGSLDATASTTYGKEVLSDQPIGYWRMSAVENAVVPNVLPQAPGLAVSDASKAKLVASPLTEANDKALELNETFLTAPESSLYTFKGSTAFTIEAWGNLTGKLSDDTPLFAKLSKGSVLLSSTFDGYWVGFDKGEQLPQVIYGSGLSFQRFTSAGGPLNQWHHYALVIDAKITFFIDGVQTSQVDPKGRPDFAFPPRFSVGGLSGNAFVPKFAGAVDEVAIYDKALSGDRLNAHVTAAHTVAP